MDKEQHEFATGLLDRLDRTAKAAERTAIAVERLIVMQAQVHGVLASILKALEAGR